MELRQIELFVVLARHRNFSRAAAAVGVAQPALSQQVKRLEQELGVVLLDRSTRPVRLTPAGSAFQVRAEAILAEALLAREEMRGLAADGRGRLVVGALPALAALWLPQVLGEFHAVRPRVELSVRQANNQELAGLLAAGQLDLAVLHAVPGVSPGTGSPAGLMMERLFDEELVVVVPPRHVLRRRHSVALEELRHAPFVLVPARTGLAHTVLSGATALGFTPDVVAEAPDVAVVRSLVAAGLGVSVMPRLPAEAPGPEVGVVRLSPPLPCHPTAVAWRGDLRASEATEALLHVMRSHARSGGRRPARAPGRAAVAGPRG